MKNKKMFFKFFIFSILFALIIFFISDYFAFLSVSDIDAVRSGGYKNSLLYYNARSKAILIVFLIALIATTFLFSGYKKEKNKVEKQEEILLEALKNISYGKDISIDNNITLGAFYDYIYKIIKQMKVLNSRMESEKEALKVSTENLAHQFKTSITMLSLIIDPDMPKYDELKRELNHAEKLVSEILQTARVESGQIIYKKENISIKDVLFTSIDTLNEYKSDIAIAINGEDFLLTGDFYWMCEAFINIMKNSKEHAESKVDILLSDRKLFKEISIKDDGVSFSKENTENIFKRYYREHEDDKGFGIGLNMSEEILKQHNALIHAEVSDGVCFIIKFYPQFQSEKMQ